MPRKPRDPDQRALSALGEDALVALLTGLLPSPRADVVVGPGDDCAVVRSPRAGWFGLLKTDCIVEGVHFHRAAKPEAIGWKAMARVLSDIAAMGGLPRHALVTLLLPGDWPVAGAEGIYRGIARAARAFAVNVVGGETSSSAQAMLSVAITGEVERKCCVLRSGGKPDDVLFVTGRLGGSLKAKHLAFRPRLDEARWLVGNARPRAMMDLSDGLAMDLPRLAAASGTGFRVDLDRVPRAPGCTPAQAVGDGEDYELLAAVRPLDADGLERAWRKRFPRLRLTRIGSLVSETAGNTPLGTGGWEHFRP